MKNKASLTVFVLLAPAFLMAQPNASDTAFVHAAANNAVQTYTAAIKGQSQLYNGADFAVYQPLDEEHPYLDTDDWITGTVTYDDNHYDNISLMYDINFDELIAEHYFGGATMRLVKNKIMAFTLAERKFINLQATTLTPGFYELLYDGKVKVYARHTKTLQESISGMQLVHEFEERTRYFVFKEGHYYPVTSKSSTLNVFGDRKKEVQQFASRNKLNFRKNRRETLVRLAEFYDQSNAAHD